MDALYVKGLFAGIMGGADDAMNIIVRIAALFGQGAGQNEKLQMIAKEQAFLWQLMLICVALMDVRTHQ